MLCVFVHNAPAQSPVNKAWQTAFGEPLASFDWTASAADAAGYVYTTGNTRLSNGKIAAYTTKHDSLGNLVWDQEFEATGIEASYGVAIQLDGSGNVDFTGPPKLKFSLLAGVPSDFVGPVVISSQREPEKVQLPVVAYPNPAKQEVQIRYELEQAAPVSLAIFNAGGQLVHIVDYVTKPPGQYTQTVGLHNLAPGVYFCTLASDRLYHTYKVTLESIQNYRSI
mgnify:CR=1 FL=1